MMKELTVVVLLFSAVYSERRTDFGAFTACVNENHSLTIDCYYPNCDDNPPFQCSLYDGDKDKGTLIARSYKAFKNNNVLFYAEPKICRLIIKNHAKIYHNQTKTYACTLSREKSTENRILTVEYTGKDKPKQCRSGPSLHVSKLLWLIPFIFFQEAYL